MTLGAIADVVDGRVRDGSDAIKVAGDPFADSRDVVAGGLFVAVAGERVDGHEYAAAAVAGGAAAVLTARPVGVPAIVVADPVRAVGMLARHLVAQLPRLCVIGITGSQGKTSTKDLLAQILETAGETVSPIGSFNTEIGVPLTALRATESTRFLISEMGARGPGQIRYLTSIVSPAVGVVLNVGRAHLGEFGSRAAIAEAKGELIAALPADGLAVLNADDAFVLAMRDRTMASVLTFGSGEDAGVRLSCVQVDEAEMPSFTMDTADASARLTLHLVGEHQARNAIAAAAVALGLGMRLEDVAAALSGAVPRSKWRMEVTTTGAGTTVINDAYNANPDSMAAALKTLSDIGRRRGSAHRTFAVLGEMKELGDTSRAEHDAIGRLAVDLAVSRLIVVGEEARPMQLAASRAAASGTTSLLVDDAAAALAVLHDEVREGDVVLVKASRAAGLEKLALALLDDPVPRDPAVVSR
ncbi:MAG: UDP-N-acetylmuramoyl-tripeptide--D-alanyl-D-alanine ligase [Nocardioidaceae bacterium]